MMQTVLRFKEPDTQLGHMLRKATATAHAFDRHAPWRRIAMKAIDDGYFQSADEFVRFLEACLRHLDLEQVMYDLAYATGVRNLADAIARRWATNASRNDAPSTDEIAGLLQSERVTMGCFRSLRAEVN